VGKAVLARDVKTLTRAMLQRRNAKGGCDSEMKCRDVFVFEADEK
jgi:hypothetical protein